jgi:hypothetical protein
MAKTDPIRHIKKVKGKHTKKKKHAQSNRIARRELKKRKRIS